MWTKDGLISFYGTPRPTDASPDWHDPAVVADPANSGKIFAWKLTHTEDSFGNRIEYDYARDAGHDGPHHWDQVYLTQIRYADYTEQGQTKFLISVTFQYQDRPDAFSEYRSGFEIRTTRRCEQIDICTHAEEKRLVRTYRLMYADHLPLNGVSLLQQVQVVGHDGERSEALPPLAFGYSPFEPKGREFFPVQGKDLPVRALANPDLELADLFGQWDARHPGDEWHGALLAQSRPGHV